MLMKTQMDVDAAESRDRGWLAGPAHAEPLGRLQSETACLGERRPDLDRPLAVRVSGTSTTGRSTSVSVDSVYRVTEVIGVSSDSWEAAARNAVETASQTVRDLRVAEVVREDVTIENGKVTGYRVRLNLSFKYDSGS
jgi:dodecin